MTEREEFFAAIEEDLDGWERYAVFSDWLIEHDEIDLAMAFRWCWANRERPRAWGGGWLLTVDENKEMYRIEIELRHRFVHGMTMNNTSTFAASMARLAEGLKDVPSELGLSYDRT